MTTLEIVTRTFRRPGMLRRNVESVRALAGSWRQVFLADLDGLGVAWANAQLAHYEPVGEWVWVLDDDDLCAHATLAQEVAAIAAVHDPQVIVVKFDHGELGVLPRVQYWGVLPPEGQIGGSSVIVRRAWWMQYRQAWASGRYAADHDFIAALWRGGPVIYWHDVVAGRVQRISRGRAEEGAMMVRAVDSLNVMVGGQLLRLEKGQEYDLPQEVLGDLLRAGFVTLAAPETAAIEPGTQQAVQRKATKKKVK